MTVISCPTCVIQTAGGTRRDKRKRTRSSRGRSSSSSFRDSRAPSQRRTRYRRAPSTPYKVGYLRRSAMALAKTLERNPSVKARQSFVTRMRNKFPYAAINKKDSPTVAVEKTLDALEVVDDEPARARNGPRSSSTKRAVAAVKKRSRRHMRRVLLGIVALLGAVGVAGEALRLKTEKDDAEKKYKLATQQRNDALKLLDEYQKENINPLIHRGILKIGKNRNWNGTFGTDNPKRVICELYSNLSVRVDDKEYLACTLRDIRDTYRVKNRFDIISGIQDTGSEQSYTVLRMKADTNKQKQQWYTHFHNLTLSHNHKLFDGDSVKSIFEPNVSQEEEDELNKELEELEKQWGHTTD